MESVPTYTLRSIYIRSSEMKIAEHFDPLVPQQFLTGGFRTRNGRIDCRETKVDNAGTLQVTKSCAFSTQFEFAYMLENSEKAVQDLDFDQDHVAKISAEICVDYVIQGESFPAPEDQMKWAASNVMLHAWPYWREFCHNAMLRMNLPVTMIPMISIAQNEQKSPE